jgi:alcohol oxidase
VQWEDIAGKLRPTDTEAKALGPDFEKDWERDFAPYPDRPMTIMNVINTWPGDPSAVDPGQYVTFGTITLYPYSRGSIHITSPHDPLNGYDFDAGFLNHPSDIKKQLWAYKKAREIARRVPYVTNEVHCPIFPNGSDASGFRQDAKSQLDANGVAVITDILYSVEDDTVIEEWIRSKLATTWHSLGTCAMKPQADGGVVDGNLNVYGTAGLKVADLSLVSSFSSLLLQCSWRYQVPENIGANVGNTAFAVGEKAALIIGMELGISFWAKMIWKVEKDIIAACLLWFS